MVLDMLRDCTRGGCLFFVFSFLLTQRFTDKQWGMKKGGDLVVLQGAHGLSDWTFRGWLQEESWMGLIRGGMHQRIKK